MGNTKPLSVPCSCHANWVREDRNSFRSCIFPCVHPAIPAQVQREWNTFESYRGSFRASSQVVSLKELQATRLFRFTQSDTLPTHFGACVALVSVALLLLAPYDSSERPVRLYAISWIGDLNRRKTNDRDHSAGMAPSAVGLVLPRERHSRSRASTGSAVDRQGLAFVWALNHFRMCLHAQR